MIALADLSTVASADANPETLTALFARFNLIGRSAPFVALLRFICQFADCDAPILLNGETGTGKELVARALHYLSPRGGQSFIPVNCGALPEHLFENEVFGHARGAFTDANSAQKGLVALAEGGTLLLDEVDSLSLKGQVALLRFLQDRSYRPLGSDRTFTANVRVIAATNADLRARVADGHFRHDLYFRLDVAHIALPPLRDRAEDIELLAEHCASRLAASYGRPEPRFDRSFLSWLGQQTWPGNIRELENTIHRSLLLAKDGVVRRTDFASGTSSATESPGSFDGGIKVARERLIKDFERRYLTWVLAETRGNVSAAAKRAGTERRQLGRLLQRYGIDKENFRHV